MAGKRGGQGHHQGKSNKKAKYLPNKVSERAFPTGTRGILITCDSGWEDRTVDEMYGVIEEHYDKLAGTTGTADAPASGGIEAALAAEVAQLKDKKQRRFPVTNVGVKGCVYLEFPKEPATPTPIEVAISICEEAVATKTLRGRHVNRLLPLTNCCYASLEEMTKMAPSLVTDEFPKDSVEGIQFAVEYEHRSSEKFDRLAVINAFVGVIPTPPHKVNLTAPTKTILVEVARNSCGVSVVPRYRELHKFNLRKCAEVPEEEEDAGHKVAKTQTEPKAGVEAKEAEPAREKVEGEKVGGEGDAGAKKEETAEAKE